VQNEIKKGFPKRDTVDAALLHNLFFLSQVDVMLLPYYLSLVTGLFKPVARQRRDMIECCVVLSAKHGILQQCC
jgi:hypothetical protein